MITHFRTLVLAATTALAVAGNTVVHAQGPARHGGAKHDLVDALATGLTLTDAQKEQVKPFLDAAKLQLKAIHHDARIQTQALTQGSSSPDTKPQLKAIRQEARAKIQAVMDDVATKITPFLTTQQQDELRLMRDQGIRQRANKPGA